MSATPTTVLSTVLRSAATAVTLLFALTACGTTPASESVPGLADQLAKVDAAIADEDFTGARDAVDALVARAARARVAGDLSSDQADRVLEAATALLEALPEEGAKKDAGEEPDGLPVPSPTAGIQEDEDSEDSEDSEDDKDDKDDEDDDEAGKGKDKGKNPAKPKAGKGKSRDD